MNNLIRLFLRLIGLLNVKFYYIFVYGCIWVFCVLDFWKYWWGYYGCWVDDCNVEGRKCMF